MAGRTPSLAYDSFVKPLSQAVSCVTQNTFVASPFVLGRNQTLALNQGQPSKLRCNPSLFVDVRIIFRIVEAEGQIGPWKASTKAYYYQISDKDQREILSYHWHPFQAPTYPHLHLAAASGVTAALRKSHLPTGRVSLEEALRFLISQLQVEPLKKSWENILKSTQSKFEQFRTWPR